MSRLRENAGVALKAIGAVPGSPGQKPASHEISGIRDEGGRRLIDRQAQRPFGKIDVTVFVAHDCALGQSQEVVDVPVILRACARVENHPKFVRLE